MCNKPNLSVLMRLFVIIKMKMKMKNRLNRYVTNGRRARHGHKYAKYKKYLSMMVSLCTR